MNKNTSHLLSLKLEVSWVMRNEKKTRELRRGVCVWMGVRAVDRDLMNERRKKQ